MANNFITVEMDDGSELLIQAVDIPNKSGGMVAASSHKNKKQKAQKLVEESVPQITEFAKKLKNSIVNKTLDNAPSELEIEVSAGFSAEGKVAILSGEFSTGIVVHLKWDLTK